MTLRQTGSDYPRHRTDWAWEFLRRNDAFQAEAGRAEPVATDVSDDGFTLFQPSPRAPRAEAWGLASFPGSRSDDDREVGVLR